MPAAGLNPQNATPGPSPVGGEQYLDEDVQAGGQALHLELIQQPVGAPLQDVQPCPSGVAAQPALKGGRVEGRHGLYKLPRLHSKDIVMHMWYHEAQKLP